jgi:hypothetical protein
MISPKVHVAVTEADTADLLTSEGEMKTLSEEHLDNIITAVRMFAHRQIPAPCMTIDIT